MDVLAGGEDLAQDVLAGDVGEHPQLDLVVVAGQQPVARLGDEAGAHRAPDLGADRDVLQVRVRAREPPGRRGHLVERGVDAAVVLDQGRKRVEVGVLELGQLAPALDLGDDRVLVAKLAEHPRVGREPGLAAALLGQPELVEEDGAELLRGADRELAPGVVVDLALELVDLLGHPGADLGQPLGVEAEADPLHLGEHLDQRHLDLVQQPLDAELAEALALAVGELAGQAGVDGGVAGGLALLGGERELPVLGPRRRRREPGVGGELVQVVGAAGRVDQVGGDHRVVGEVEPLRPGRGEQALAAVAAEALDVVADQRPAPELAGERGQVGGVAGEHPVAVAGRPAAAGDRDRDRAVGELGRRALLGLDLDRLLDHPAGDDLVPLVVEPLDHGPQLELVRGVAQLRAVGRRRAAPR